MAHLPRRAPVGFGGRYNRLLTLSSLPIDDVLPQVLSALSAGRNVVLVAPPGAGKTTRVPPAILAGLRPRGRIVMLEPRRVAARAATRRIAAENGWTVGEEIGYQIRFERRFRPSTPIVVVTEGILVRWLQDDPYLEGTAVVVFDEFHERSLAADLALAMTRKVQREARADLLLVAMSATLRAEPLAEFLDAAIVESRGRLHPVEVEFETTIDDRPLEARVARAVRGTLRSPRQTSEGSGDVLVFLPGVGEIRRAGEALADLPSSEFRVLPLHGELTGEAQDDALSRAAVPEGVRRVILATNVAETSVTVEGVRTVIDSGLVRTLRFDPATGLDALVLGRVSRASADQRAGRAGREGPGRCIRLWTAADDRALQPFERPEIQRVDLAGAALELLGWGERRLAEFGWYEAPEPARLEAALALLERLGALDAQGLTATGHAMAALPVAPRLARLVLEGRRLGVGREAAEIAALLSERRSRSANRPAPRIARSDLLLERDELQGGARARVLELAAKLTTSPNAERAEQGGVKSPRLAAESALLRAIATAYPDRVARPRSESPSDDRAVLVGGRGVRLGRESAVRNEPLYVAVELDDRGADAWVRTASAVEREWLPESGLRRADSIAFDSGRRRVIASSRWFYEDLLLDERERPIPPERRQEAEEVLGAAAAERLAEALPLDAPEVQALRARWAWLAGSLPELELPPCDDVALRALLPLLVSGARSFDDLRRAPLAEVLLGSLSHRQREALAREAPERLEVPSGSRVRLEYEPGRPPVLSVRIQEMFGLRETPRVGGGRVAVLIHLLAPSGRPQQVTQDLASFWKNTYPQVKKELAARYPKHAWPDDPAEAAPRRAPGRPGRRIP